MPETLGAAKYPPTVRTVFHFGRILVLRNPDDKAAMFSANLKRIFELPEGAAKTYHFHSPWKNDRSRSDIKIASDELHSLELKPFEVLVLETE